MKQRHRKHRRPVRELWTSPLLMHLTPMPDIAPMTGRPWALPYHVRWISLDEANTLYPSIRSAPESAAADPCTAPRSPTGS